MPHALIHLWNALWFSNTPGEVISSHFHSLDTFWGLPPRLSAIASLAPACIMRAGRRWENHCQSWQPLSPRNQSLTHRPMQTLELPSVNGQGKSEWMRASEREGQRVFGLCSNCSHSSIKTDNCTHIEFVPENSTDFHRIWTPVIYKILHTLGPYVSLD